MLESEINDILVTHIYNDNSLGSIRQWTYRSGYSTEYLLTHLTDLTNYCIEVIYKGQNNTENPDSESRSEHVPQCKWSCEEQAGFDKNWSVKAYSLIAAALNAIYKANQSTNSPFKQKIVLKLAYLLGPLEQKTKSCTGDHLISNHEL